MVWRRACELKPCLGKKKKGQEVPKRPGVQGAGASSKVAPDTLLEAGSSPALPK